MSNGLSTVKPGDLITSRLWGELVAKCLELEQRIANLENGTTNGLVITGLDPSGQVRIGDELRVLGRNFSTPAQNNVVRINGSRVEVFKFSSSATQLVFDIPQVPIPSSGSSVLEVQNAAGETASRPLDLAPALAIPQGRIEVMYLQAPILPVDDPNLEAGRDYVFLFEMTARVDLRATYRLTPQISASGWQAALLENDSDLVRASNTVTLPGTSGSSSAASHQVRVRVRIAEGASSSANLTLGVVEITSGTRVTPGNASINLQLDSPPPVPDDRVRISLSSTPNADVIGSRVVFQRNEPGGIRFNLLFSQAGKYQVATAFRSPTGWTRLGLSPRTFNRGAGENQDVTVTLRAEDLAVETDLLFDVTSDDGSLSVQYVQPIGVS